MVASIKNFEEAPCSCTSVVRESRITWETCTDEIWLDVVNGRFCRLDSLEDFDDIIFVTEVECAINTLLGVGFWFEISVLWATLAVKMVELEVTPFVSVFLFESMGLVLLVLTCFMFTLEEESVFLLSGMLVPG